MASGGLVAVNDLVLGKVVYLSAIDAVQVTRKFPARYTFNDPDPQAGIALLAAFQEKGAYTVLPTLTGAKGGNAALASLITGLASLGLVIDQTT